MMKKTLCTILALSMLCGAVSSCSNADDGQGSSAAESSAASDSSISAGASQETSAAGITYPLSQDSSIVLTVGVTASDYVTDYENNYLTNKLEEVSGVTIQAEVFPATDATTKLTLMVTGGQELPDILTFGTDTNTRNTYADAGVLVALDDYFADSAMSQPFLDRCAEVGFEPDYVLNQLRSLDGSIYAMPTYDYKPTNVYCNRAYINQDWLDTLGLSQPTTLDELTEVLIAFRDKDPNGNGQRDEVPMSGMYSYTSNSCSLNWLQSLFIYNDLTANRYLPLSETDGKIDVAYDKEAYREFLKYVNMLISENLLDEAVLTQSLSDMRAQLQTEVQTIGMMTGSASGFGDNLASWQPIQQPVGYNGLQQVTAKSTGIGARWCITTFCEYPELAFQLGMACYEDDSLLLSARYGEEGVDWRYAEEGEESIFGDAITPNLCVINPVWGDVSNQLWQAEILPGLCSSNTFVEVFDGNKLYGEYLHGQSVAKNMDFGPAEEDIVGTILYTEEESDRWNEVRSTINTYVEEARALFCVGQLDPNSDSDWNNYLAELEKMNYKEMLEADTIAYKRTYGIQ